MDQNFSLMAQSRANYYTAGSPVQFVRVELLKGDVTGEVAVCLTFKNVGTEPLTGFIIHFKCKDASGQILCEDDFYYEQLNVQPGELFGADDAVFVSDTPVSSVEIEQDRAFLNGRGVDLRNYKRVRLQAPRVLPGSIARRLQTIYHLCITWGKQLFLYLRPAGYRKRLVLRLRRVPPQRGSCFRLQRVRRRPRLHQGNPDPHPGGSPADRRTAAARNQRRGQWR